MKVFKSSFISVFTFALLGIGSLQADYEYHVYEPKSPTMKSGAKPEKKTPMKNDVVSDKRVVIPKLKGIVVNGDDKLPPDHVVSTAHGVEYYRISSSIRSKQRTQLKKKLQKYIGRTLTFEKLSEIKKDIQKHYQKNGQAVVIVSVPEQDVTNNVIVIDVLESKVGKITIQGNKHFSTERYQEYVSLQEDDIVSNGQVENDLAFINRNPWRLATVTYSPGEQYGTTDITYNIRDERPFRVYAGADNTGFKVTDIYRVFFGFNWGNFLSVDQILSYQYTASPDFKQFQAHTAHYTVPLPNKNLLVFFGGYSSVVAAHEIIPANVSKGQSLQASGRYVYPFMPENNWMQEIKAGIDYKRTNNDLVVGETVLSSAYATIFQYVVAYETSFSWDTQTIEGEVEGFIQPFAIGDSMTSSNYDRLRPGANTRYAYIKAAMKYNYTWLKTGMDIYLHTTLQVASGTLLPLEELGIGGFYSVRGYPERAVNVDDGLIVNFEVRSPKVSLFHRKDAHPIDGLSGVGFFDFGFGGIARKVPNEPSAWGLAAIGPAIRYDYGSWLHVRADFGLRLTGVPFGADSGSLGRVYFSAVASF